MFIRVKSGQNINIMIMNMPICWSDGDEPYSYVETINCRLIKDLILDSTPIEIHTKNSTSQKGYSLDGLDNEMINYFEGYNFWSKKYEGMVISTFVDLKNIDNYEYIASEEPEFFKSLKSIVFCPVPIWRSTITCGGLDTPITIDCEFIEVDIDGDKKLCGIEKYETWRSILIKTDKLIGDIRKRGDVFLEGYCSENRVLRPYLGS